MRFIPKLQVCQTSWPCSISPHTLTDAECALFLLGDFLLLMPKYLSKKHLVRLSGSAWFDIFTHTCYCSLFDQTPRNVTQWNTRLNLTYLSFPLASFSCDSCTLFSLSPSPWPRLLSTPLHLGWRTDADCSWPPFLAVSWSPFVYRVGLSDAIRNKTMAVCFRLLKRTCCNWGLCTGKVLQDLVAMGRGPWEPRGHICVKSCVSAALPHSSRQRYTMGCFPCGGAKRATPSSMLRAPADKGTDKQLNCVFVWGSTWK